MRLVCRCIAIAVSAGDQSTVVDRARLEYHAAGIADRDVQPCAPGGVTSWKFVAGVVGDAHVEGEASADDLWIADAHGGRILLQLSNRRLRRAIEVRRRR